jgi:transposase
MRTTSLSLDLLRDHFSRGRAFELRRTKYIGMAKTHFQHVLTATAIIFIRINNRFRDLPRKKTRTSAFEKLIRPVKYKQ